MRNVMSLAVAVAIAASVAQSSAAEPVPDRATGIWSIQECGGDGLTVLVEENVALMFETSGEQTRVAMVRAEWLAGSVVLILEDEAEELVLPPPDGLHRCAALPVGFSLIFAESVAVLREFGELEGRCAGATVSEAQCGALVFELIDVNEDGVFSKAELSRAMRAASFFIGYWINVDETQDPLVPMEKLSVAWFAASVLGPFVATNLIDSYDFDGDGRLSLKELLQDRLPEQGIEGAAAGLAVQMPPEMMSGLMRTVNGLLGALR